MYPPPADPNVIISKNRKSSKNRKKLFLQIAKKHIFWKNFGNFFFENFFQTLFWKFSSSNCFVAFSDFGKIFSWNFIFFLILFLFLLLLFPPCPLLRLSRCLTFFWLSDANRSHFSKSSSQVTNVFHFFEFFFSNFFFVGGISVFGFIVHCLSSKELFFLFWKGVSLYLAFFFFLRSLPDVGVIKEIFSRPSPTELMKTMRSLTQVSEQEKSFSFVLIYFLSSLFASLFSCFVARSFLASTSSLSFVFCALLSSPLLFSLFLSSSTLLLSPVSSLHFSFLHLYSLLLALALTSPLLLGCESVCCEHVPPGHRVRRHGSPRTHYGFAPRYEKKLEKTQQDEEGEERSRKKEKN